MKAPEVPGHWSAAQLARAQALLPFERLSTGLLAPRPQFYGLRPAKDALARELGEQALLEWWMAALGRPGAWRARWCPLRPMLSHAESLGWPIQVYSPGREVDVPALHAVGGPDQPAARHRCRSMALIRVPDAVVYSKSNLVRAGDVALLDHQGDELARMPCHLSTDGGVLAQRGDEVALAEQDDLPELPRALSLLGLHSFAYGHWLEEFLPKLGACLTEPGVETLTVLVDAQMPTQLFESLALVLGGMDRVRIVQPGEALKIRELWAVTAPLYYPIGPAPGTLGSAGWHVMDGPWMATCMQRLSARWAHAVPVSTLERVYLGRTDGQHRRLLNRPDVEAWFRGQGFSIVDAHDVPFLQQMALMRGAKWLVAPEGSALSNSLFAPAGTRIGMLAGPQVMHMEAYAQVVQAQGQHLCLCLGRQPQALRPGEYFGNYTTDLDTLPQLLERLERDAAQAGGG